MTSSSRRGFAKIFDKLKRCSIGRFDGVGSPSHFPNRVAAGVVLGATRGSVGPTGEFGTRDFDGVGHMISQLQSRAARLPTKILSVSAP